MTVGLINPLEFAGPKYYTSDEKGNNKKRKREEKKKKDLIKFSNHLSLVISH